LYCLTVSDSAGGFASYPSGLTADPQSIAQAEAATGGLLEVSFLPTINWAPAYLARIAAHPSGKLDPTPEEIASSSQSACMLYVNELQDVPRSGTEHRTAFLRTLDRLGYAGLCDAYDLNNHANGVTNNQLAGRATVEQAMGYALIVHDAGRYPSETTLPIGGAVEGFYPQTQWYRDWLAGGAGSEAGQATLWLIGGHMAIQAGPDNPLVFGDMGVTVLSTGQPVGVLPQVVGQSSFTWADSTTTDFSGDVLQLLDPFNNCQASIENDGLGTSGTAVATHTFEYLGSPGEGAIVMNADPTAQWNTILSSLVWEQIAAPAGGPGMPGDVLAERIIQAVLPPDCLPVVDPTDVARSHPDVPLSTRLHANIPNPFNPTTTIRFDLAGDAHVELRIYSVAGRLVRTLVKGPMVRNRHAVVWDGMDDAGAPVSSGIYFYRLEAGDFSDSRKMVVLK
jgi:hypothetical protein